MTKRSQSSVKGLGGEQIEGRRAVTELLTAKRRRVHEVFVSEGSSHDDIVELCFKNGVNVRALPRHEFDRRTTTEVHQGVVARADALPSHDLGSLTAKPKPFLLGLDGVTDPHNFGALLRTAECAGVTGVVIPKNRSVNVTATAAKASAGAVEHMPMASVSGLPQAIQGLRKSGLWVVGLDPDGPTSIYDLKVAEDPIVLVMGAEGAGLSRLVKERCDVLASIPQYGDVASLNVSAAGAIAMFEVARRRSSAV